MLTDLFFAKRYIYVLIAAFLWTILETNWYYVMMIFSLLVFLLKYGIKPFLINRYHEDFIARSFIFVWIYGVIVGLIRGNVTQYVVANFAGLFCYTIYFILVKTRIDAERLVKILLVGGVIMSLYSILRILSFIYGFTIPFVNVKIGLASTGQFRIYFSSMAIIYVLLGCSFYNISKGRLYNIKHSYITFFISFVSLFFVSASKGFMLGAIYVCGIILFLLFFSNISTHRINAKFLLIIPILFILYFLLDRFDYLDVIYLIFDQDDSSNIARYEQLDYLMKDMSLGGKGLGAVIPGFDRAGNAPYGFELTYINILHKFGVLSILLFYGWMYMICTSFRGCLRKRNLNNNIVVLSSLGYLFPAIGNPSLFHPSLVVMNAIALYLLRDNKASKQFIA